MNRLVLRSRNPPGAETTASDNDLAALAAGGDGDAFALLFGRHNVAVYRYCLVCLRHRESAEDGVQETFVSAWKSLRSFRPRESDSFRKWLFVIAKHKVIDLLRRLPDDMPLDDVVLLVADRAPTPAEQAEQAERDRLLWSLVVELPEGQRHVLGLRLAGFKGDEIATILATSEDAVKQRQARGEANLRRLWGTHYGDR